MFNDECGMKMLDLFTNPLFKKGFFDFFLKMQQEGIEEARKFWSAYADKNLFPGATEMYERMVDFYIILGFVPRAKYDEVLKENNNLKEENRFLRDTIRELQLSLFTEGGERVQQIWHGIIDKQLEMNKEIAKNFFELFRQLKVGSQ
ncbi:MAG TPA: hypothetical protein VEM15_02740 [Thermodesulfobacteriota bacterium]|nr:hypothetical protein [Thermodesulfobacteriota bacterium]